MSIETMMLIGMDYVDDDDDDDGDHGEGMGR